MLADGEFITERELAVSMPSVPRTRRRATARRGGAAADAARPTTCS